jgi:hypothetical protein
MHSKTCDPIWAVDTGSLFILSSRARDFFGTTGLTFLLKDYDAVGTNEVLRESHRFSRCFAQGQG